MPDEPQISDELLAFIRKHIHSVEQLEVLLMVRRQSTTDWTAAKVSDELRTGLESAADRLADLEARGLLTSTMNGTARLYRYQPRSELETVVSSLDRAYEERKYTIIDLIFCKPVDKIRVFAEAFRIRRGEGDK